METTIASVPATTAIELAKENARLRLEVRRLRIELSQIHTLLMEKAAQERQASSER